MTDAPERIWVEPGLPGYTYEPNDPYTTEYIRADLDHPMTVAEAAKVLLAEMTQDDAYYAITGDMAVSDFADVLRAIADEGGE